MDSTLEYMKSEGLALTLETYVAINWCGDYEVADILSSPELAAELPTELLENFLKYGDVEDISAEVLSWIAELAEAE